MLIFCILTSVLGALVPSIMIMASVVVLMGFFYGEVHLTQSSNCFYDDEKRLLGLKLTTCNALILVLNVYLPCQSYDNVDEYQFILGKIQAISDSFQSSNIFIIGDFNADLTKTGLFLPFL